MALRIWDQNRFGVPKIDLGTLALVHESERISSPKESFCMRAIFEISVFVLEAENLGTRSRHV